MKRTSISILEQHLEKIFLLVFLLAFLGVVAKQFTGGGNTVTLNSNEVTFDRAFEQLGSLAAQQLASMDDTAVDPNVPLDVEDKSTSVLALLQHPLNIEDSGLGIPLGPTTQSIDIRSGPVERLAFGPIDFPPPTLTGVSQYAGTLDPLVVSAYPELRNVVSAQQPFDTRMVSVGFNIDSSGLYNTLEQSVVPERWWKGKLYILDVQLERRSVYPDSQLGEATLVSPMPGRFSARQTLQNQLDAGAAQQTFTNARVQAQSVVHPNMYRISSGTQWLPPTVDTQSENNRRIQQKIQQFKALNSQINALNTRIQQVFLERRGNYYAQAGGGGGGGGSRSNNNRESNQQTDQQRKEARKDNLIAQRDQLDVQLTKITDELNGLGVQVVGENLNFKMPEYDPGPARLNDTDTVIAWTNDIDVTSGETYQYRVRVILRNPFFGNAGSLDDASASLAETPHLPTQWSSWSEPITIENDVYWFATRANEGGNQGIGFIEPACTIDLYRFYYGYWRRTQARLHAGDSISEKLDVASLELPVFQLDNAQQEPQLLVAPLSIDTGAVVLDIRANPSISGDRRSRNLISVVIRDAQGNIAAHLIDAATATGELRTLLDASVLSASVATVSEPQGDIAGAFQPTLENDQEESETAPTSSRRGGLGSR